MNIAEKFKKQTDKILRQRSQGPNAGTTIIESGTGSPEVSNPASDLTRHKTSGDHDERYAQIFTDLNDAPASYEGSAGKIIRVKDDLTGLEFVSAPPAENGIPTGGAAKQILAKSSANNYAAEWVSDIRGIAFYIDGDLTTSLKASIIAPCALEIINVKASAGTAPTGADLILDIHKNGTTIFTTQTNRPTITAGETSEDSQAPDVIAVAAGDLISLQLDQIGSTVAGADLSVTVVCEVA